jgi:hypothetical protein
MNMPAFSAEASLYRTSGHYRHSAGAADMATVRIADANGGAIRPQLCSLTCLGRCTDDVCAGLTGEAYSNCLVNCGRGCGCNFPPPPPPVQCEGNLCPPSSVCCFDGAGHCCPAGSHCCSDGHGCCPNGRTCRSLFGFHYCDPIFSNLSFAGQDGLGAREQFSR